MKTIEHFYSADLNWMEDFAQKMGGKVEGNFIILPEEIQSGTRYVLDCGEGIVAYYLDVTYKKNFHLIQKNLTDDFVGLYYNLTKGEASVEANNLIYDVGQFNLSTIDSTLISDYHVKVGSSTYAICIFIKKTAISVFAEKNNVFIKDINKIIDPAKNTIIRFDRMSNDSYHLLHDLHKLPVGGPIFNLNLIGTVHLLISNYLKKITQNRIIIQNVNETDLASIIDMQMFLIKNLDEHFPSITLMANKANMSESKFKILFRKITGLTPNKFFMDNKLLKAKDLLETKQLSITQVSDQLKFTNNSYFSSKFKEQFEMSPKTFVKQL